MTNYNQIWAGVWDQLSCWSSVVGVTFMSCGHLSLHTIKTAENNVVLHDEMNKETFLERENVQFYICIHIYIYILY